MKFVKLCFSIYILSIVSVNINSQTKQDYDLYTTYLNDYYRLWQSNAMEDEKLEPVVITNTMSDFALMQYDENYVFNSEYKFSKEKFIFDKKSNFEFKLFIYLDKETQGYRTLDGDDTKYNIPYNEEMNLLVEKLKGKLLEPINLKLSKLNIDMPVKIISKKEIDKCFKNARRKVANRYIEDTFLEFSPVVYSDNYAMFYINIGSDCYSVADESGDIFVFERTDNGWGIVGKSYVHGKYRSL